MENGNASLMPSSWLGSPARLWVLGVLCWFCVNGYAQAKRTPSEASIATKHYYLLLKSIQRANYQPTSAARLLGYVGLTLHESVAPFSGTYQSVASLLHLTLPKPPASVLHYPEVSANAALHRISILMIEADTKLTFGAYYEPAIKQRFDSLFRANTLSLKLKYTDSKAFVRSVQFGDTIARAVFAHAKTDGGFRNTLDEYLRDVSHYESPLGATWHDSLTAFGYSLQPTWGRNRTFVPNIVAQAQAPAPIPFSTDTTSAFYQQALEVFEYGRTLTFEQHYIAEYWKDNAFDTFTPPGHTVCILTQLLENEKADLFFAAYAYAKLGIALSDAFVCCWHTKYQTNTIRPETYIKRYIDPKFKPAIVTPPFPEYTSGHSAQAGAAYEVLTDLFGADYSFTDHTPNLFIYFTRKRLLRPRTFESFLTFAQEVSMSRLYGGIHFRQACESGFEQGRIVGKQVNYLAWKK
jgi:hypothetical protein